MKKVILCIRIIFFIIMFSSCSATQKIELLKPEPDEASPIEYPVNSSYISFPITLAIKDIETQTNKALNGLIYEDTN